MLQSLRIAFPSPLLSGDLTLGFHAMGVCVEELSLKPRLIEEAPDIGPADNRVTLSSHGKVDHTYRRLLGMFCHFGQKVA
jgi:hypothetical protein